MPSQLYLKKYLRLTLSLVWLFLAVAVKKQARARNYSSKQIWTFNSLSQCSRESSGFDRFTQVPWFVKYPPPPSIAWKLPQNNRWLGNYFICFPKSICWTCEIILTTKSTAKQWRIGNISMNITVPDLEFSHTIKYDLFNNTNSFKIAVKRTFRYASTAWRKH